MPHHDSSSATRSRAHSTLLVAMALATAIAAIVVPAASSAAGAVPDHLVLSEIVTGGASASDEFIELYNPTASSLPLEGLEIVYVSATGATVSRRASWPVGAPVVPARGHVLVANDLGAFAPIADAMYSGGMAATGGSVALRIQGATSAIDAVGWGTAASSWMEGTPAPAPAAGQSLERLPGGSSGSTTDSDANAADFALRTVPDPQNLGSPPTPGTPAPPTAPPPSGIPSPVIASPTPAPTDVPTPIPSATGSPSPESVSIASARALPDGARTTVEGVTLTDFAFTDGGGYLVDATGGIAVLLDGGTFSRGRSIRVTGELDDRFWQRTMRVSAADVMDLGPAAEPIAAPLSTGAIDEAVEGRLVRTSATIVGSASTLTSGVAFDLDDGTGPTRLIVATATGIDAGGWTSGTRLELVGVIGQRDSSGTGTAGYRIQPRDSSDVIAVMPPASATPTIPPSGSSSPSASASATPDVGVMTIAQARAVERNGRVRVRGIVTLPTGIVDAQTAAIQDASGAIVLRLGDEAGALRAGQRVDVTGARSTKSGMETIRVTTAPLPLGNEPDPVPVPLTTGAASEPQEARLVLVRGGLVAAARRASSGTVSMEIDDGSGPLRVVFGSTIGIDRAGLLEGTWVEVRGVLGQETTGALPTRGYRLWPRSVADLRITAASTEEGSGTGGGDGGAVASAGSDAGNLGDLHGSAPSTSPIGATLVLGRWRELGFGGLLWDGQRLVALPISDGPPLEAVLAGRRPPVAVALDGLRSRGADPSLGLPGATVDGRLGAVRPSNQTPAPPSTIRPRAGDPARWFALVGRLQGQGTSLTVRSATGVVPLERRCSADEPLPRGVVTVTGIVVADRDAVVVPCGGIVAGSTLVRIAARAPQAGTTADDGTHSLVSADASTMPGSLLAAVLLGVSALVLTGTAAWMRWRPGGEPVVSSAEADPDEDGEPHHDGATPASAPVLTLVSLPHERSP